MSLFPHPGHLNFFILLSRSPNSVIFSMGFPQQTVSFPTRSLLCPKDPQIVQNKTVSVFWFGYYGKQNQEFERKYVNLILNDEIPKEVFV